MSPTDLRFVDSKLAAKGLSRKISLNVRQWLLVPQMLRETDLLGVVSERIGMQLAAEGIVCRTLILRVARVSIGKSMRSIATPAAKPICGSSSCLQAPPATLHPWADDVDQFCPGTAPGCPQLVVQPEFLDLAGDGVAADAQALGGFDAAAAGVLERGADHRRFEDAGEAGHDAGLLGRLRIGGCGQPSLPAASCRAASRARSSAHCGSGSAAPCRVGGAAQTVWCTPAARAGRPRTSAPADRAGAPPSRAGDCGRIAAEESFQGRRRVRARPTRQGRRAHRRRHAGRQRHRGNRGRMPARRAGRIAPAGAGAAAAADESPAAGRAPDHLRRRHHREPVADVLELAHVARQSARCSHSMRRVGDALGLDAELARALLQEVARQQRDVLAPLAQRAAGAGGSRSGGGTGPRGTGPAATRSSRFWCVAAMTRTLALQRRGGRRRGRTGRRTARAAGASAGRTACRRSRRGTACRRRPARSGRGACVCAPVKAPRSWPNSSDSSRSFGIAAVLMATNGLAGARAVLVQRARDQLLAGARLAGDQHRRRSICDSRPMARNTSCIAGAWPSISGACADARLGRAPRAGSPRPRGGSARPPWSTSNGLGRYSKAPPWNAATALSRSEYAVMMMTGRPRMLLLDLVAAARGRSRPACGCRTPAPAASSSSSAAQHVARVGESCARECLRAPAPSRAPSGSSGRRRRSRSVSWCLPCHLRSTHCVRCLTASGIRILKSVRPGTLSHSIRPMVLLRRRSAPASAPARSRLRAPTPAERRCGRGSSSGTPGPLSTTCNSSASR